MAPQNRHDEADRKKHDESNRKKGDDADRKKDDKSDDKKHSASNRKSDESDRKRGEGGRDRGDSERSVPNPIQVQKFLGGLDYPVSKQDILDRARENGADENVMDALERIPDGEYDAPTAVSREVGQLE